MAVAFDAFTNLGSGTGNISGDHTPVGTPRGVLVQVNSTGAADEVSGVTYGTEALVEVALSPVTVAGENGNVSTWFLGSGIPTGAQTVTVTVSAGTNKNAVVYTLTADTDTEVVDTSSISNTSLENPSVTVSLGSRTCFVAEVFFSGQGDPANFSPLTNWTSRATIDFGSDSGGFYSYDIIGSTDVTAGYTSAADDVALLATAISEVSAPATGRLKIHPGMEGLMRDSTGGGMRG